KTLVQRWIDQGSGPVINGRQVLLGHITPVDNTAVAGFAMKIVGYFRRIPAPAADQQERPARAQLFRQRTISPQQEQDILTRFNRAQVKKVTARQLQFAQDALGLARRQWSKTRTNAHVCSGDPLGRNTEIADHFLAAKLGDRQEMHATSQAAVKMALEMGSTVG